MSQVKTNSNGFKVSAKRAIALVSAAALSLFGLVATSTAANAAAVTKFSYASVQRNVSANTFTLRANETLRAVVSATKSSFVSDGVKAISSNHGITPISGVTIGDKSYQWTSVGCMPSMVNTTTAVPCASATEIQVYVFQTITNTTSSPITITSNIDTARFTYGSDSISASSSNASASRTISSQDPEMTSGIVITSDDRYLSGNIDACLDSALYAVGDTLTWESSASINGTPLADDYHMNNAYLYFRNGGSALTSFTVAAGQSTTLYLYATGGNLSTSPGTLSISIDLKKGSTSVLKACPQGGGGMNYAYPSALSAGSETGSPSPTLTPNQNILANSVDMASPANFVIAPDGNGMFFYAANNAAAPTKIDIIRLKPTGGFDSSFGGTGSGGKIQVTAGAAIARGFGWYGDKTKWVMTTRTNGMTPTFAVISGTTKTKTSVSKNMTNLNSSTVCGTGFSAMNIRHLTIRTASPVAVLTCIKQGETKTMLISIATSTGAATKISDLGAAVSGKCVTDNIGVNPDATSASQHAAIVYTTVGSGCGMNTSIDSRTIVALKVDGRVAYARKTIATNPFGGTEPAQVRFGVGQSANTWIGSSLSYGMNGATFGKLLTVSAAGGLVAGSVPVIPTANADWGTTHGITPVKQISSTRWLVVRQGFKDGENAVAPAILNPSTGAITTGKAVKYTYMNSYTQRNLLTYSLDASSKNMYFYAATSSTKYSVAKWTLPTS